MARRQLLKRRTWNPGLGRSRRSGSGEGVEGGGSSNSRACGGSVYRGGSGIIAFVVPADGGECGRRCRCGH